MQSTHMRPPFFMKSKDSGRALEVSTGRLPLQRAETRTSVGQEGGNATALISFGMSCQDVPACVCIPIISVFNKT